MVVLLFDCHSESEGVLRVRRLVTALLRSDEHFADNFEINGRVNKRATQDQSGDPTPYSEEAQLSIRMAFTGKKYARK